MKKPITILICCALLAPLAFAQPESKGKGQGASTTEAVTVTGTIIKMQVRKARRPITSRSGHLLFARIVLILQEVMFSTGLVTLWTRTAR